MSSRKSGCVTGGEGAASPNTVAAYRDTCKLLLTFARVPVTRYRYWDSKIPNPWAAPNHA